ncbi:MAG: ABC transporter ATP-binding protein [Bifidobacteriaceae bacterium]|nr:ABC transporter ATP-binding protein [Bifidobacteriaceae bacterium]
MTEYAIEAIGVDVAYGDYTALKNLNFQAEAGKIVSILGPNGAGKSTFVDAIVGAHKIKSGTIRTLGLDPITQAKNLRRNIGVVLQSAGFPPGMKVKDILYAWRRYVPGMSKAEVNKIAEEIELIRLMDRPLNSLSGGERRRVDIAIALYGEPKLIILDEPTTGLDPMSRERVWDIIKHQRDKGATILLTSHYLDEVEYLADVVSVLKQGNISVTGTVDELARSVPSQRACSLSFGPSAAGISFGELGVVSATGELAWSSLNPAADVERVLAIAKDKGLQVTDIAVEAPSLGAAYASLVAVEEKE